MQMILGAVQAFTDWLWGIPMLIFIIGGGFYLSVRLGFLQFTKLGFILKNTIGKAFGQKTEQGKFPSFQAVTGALASTLGAGNIIGTAMAIAYGGPGGVFWLWLSGLVCCCVKYSEVTLAMKYRRLNEKGQWEGGPQIYLERASGKKWTSISYAAIAVCCLFLAAAGQIGSGVDNLGTLGVPRIASTVVLTALAALVVIGGMSSLLKVTEKVVPIMSVLYMAGALAVIVLNIQNVPAAIASVFQYAFTGRAAVGGFAGAAVSQTIRWGVARGCFSNDAGNGSTTVAHSVAEVNHPIQQSIWAVFEVFFDTIIVCTMTCLVVLSTGVWQESMDPAVMTATTFQNTIGTAGGLLVTVAVVLFTFTTACAQIEFCTAHVARLFGESKRTICRWIMLALLFMGGIVGIDALIAYVDFFSGLYTIINMTVVYLCASQIAALTKEYFADTKKWETEKWPEWKALEEEYQSKHQ